MKWFYLTMVFLSGAVVALNLIIIKSGVPDDGSWLKVAFAVFLGFFFGASAMKKK